MEHISNDQKDHPNLPENSQELCDETRNQLLSSKESPWELKQQHDQNLLMEWKP